MKKRWETGGRSLDRRAEHHLKSLKIPLRRRMDVMLFAGILVVFLLLALVWGIGIIVGDRLGIFDPPPIRSIEDNRILTNIREEIDKKPLLDAVKHLDDGRLYIAQQGGTVHSYNPSTRLWESEQPFLETDLLTPELVMLRSGSGADPLSNRARECPDPESLWGVSANAGLVRRINGRWQRVIGDSSFIGSQNKPVQKGQLTAAAVSKDGNWLVVGTKEEAIGVYHLESRQWVPLQSRVFKEFPSLSVSHIAWWQNRFWVGGPSGLISMEIEEQTHMPHIFPDPSFKGRILDLDVDLANRLWVLEERNCQGEGGNCLRLTRFLDLQHPGERVVDERSIYPYLNTGDLHFAQYWGDRLLVAGKEGVFSYDPRFHSWECHFKGSVLSTLSLPDGKGFYFGYTGGVGVAAIDDYEPWRNPDNKSKCWQVSDAAARIKKIRIGRQNEVVGLAESGKVFAIAKDKARKVFEGGRTMFDPSKFRAVFGFGNTNTVLFVGDEGALVHDIAARTYKDIPSALLPEWLRRSDWQRLQFLTSGDNTYAASLMGAKTVIYQIPTSAVTAADFRAAVRLAGVPGPVDRLRNWNDQGVVVIAGGEGNKGWVFRFTPQKETLIGAGSNIPDMATILDVATYGNGLMATTSYGVWYYDYTSREWKKKYGLPFNTFPTEVANFNGQLLVVTANGKLMKLDGQGKYSELIGGERGFGIYDIELSDVMERNGKLYLAGSGKIYLYDPDKRQITNQWDLPVKGEVTLKGFIGEEPLALCANRVTRGNIAIDEKAGPVINLSIDTDYIWTVRIEDGQKYLIRYPIDKPLRSPGVCFFRRPGAGKGVTQILDAVSLPSKNDLIAAATNVGVHFYSPEARSWYQTDLHTRIPKVDRIYELNKHLVITGKEGDNFGITFATLDSIQLPTSTSTDSGTVTFKPRPQHVWVKAFTIDSENKERQRVAFIDEQGAILEWKEGRKEEILPPPGKGPAPTQLRRVYNCSEDHKENGIQGYLLFTTDNTLLRYDLVKRFWQEIPLDGLPLEAIDINIEREETPKIVVAKTKSGTFFWGTFESPTDSTKRTQMQMELIFTPSTGFKSSGDRLMDVQQRGGKLWTFVLDDRIKYYDPHQRQWDDDVLIAGATGFAGFAGIRAFYSVGNRGVLVENDGRTWWVARYRGNRPRSFARYRLQPAHTTALDTRGTIWRFTADGQLFKHQRPTRGNYPERGTLYKTPFLIDPGNVRQAFEWKKCILFETEQGIRVLDTSSRREIHLTGMALGFTGTREVFRYGDQLLLRNADTILVLLQKNDQFIETLRLPYKGEWPSEISGAANKRKIKDQWPRLKKKVGRLPNGKTAYDPIMGLFIDSKGELYARRPEENDPLNVNAAVRIDSLPDSLDVGWLKWNRAQKNFEVKTPTGKRTMSPSEFVQNQRLIFEEVDAILALGEKKVYAANSYGIWTHSRKDLSLTDSTITFQPLDWTSPISAAHEHFIDSSGGIYSVKGNLLPLSSQTMDPFDIGDVTFSEDINLGRVKAKVKTDGRYIDAFGAHGFTWDQGKRGIFYGENNQLLIQSDAGFHPVKGYTGFRRELERELLSQPQILSGDPEPSNRTLVNNDLWIWEKQNGGVTIRLKGKSYNFKPIIGQSGFGFTSDRLLDAVTYQNRMYVMTEAFLEVADSSKQFSSFKARRFPFKSTSSLKNIKDAAGRDDLILFSPEGNLYWDNQSQQFVRVTPGASYDPNRERLLARIPVDQPRLRFRSRWKGSVKKEVKVKNVNGKESWVSFQFTKNSFPFDVVTSIHADKSRSYLCVGTGAGLQVYSSSLDTKAGLGKMDELYELRGSATGALEAVTKVGEPLDKPGLVIARSAAFSIESRGGTNFRQCTNPALLDKRLRLETDFWRFVDQKGQLDGRYKDENGNFSPERITLQQGRLPHDLLKDIVAFENRVFAIWQNGWLTIHPTLSMELKKGIINQNKQDARPQRFIVIPQDISSDMPGQSAVPVSRGVYVEGQGWRWQRRLFQYNNGNWVEITQPDVRTRIFEYADNPPIVHRKHLVLLPGEFTFKRRSLDGKWLALPWKDGRLSIDKWSDFFFLDNQLWAASPLGLTTFSRTPDGQIVLDPDHFIVIQEPGEKNNPLEITDIEVDQKSHIVTLRCEADSYQVYQGTLTDPVQRDRGIFKPLDSDSFVEKELVGKKESNVWEWHLKGNKDRSPGWLEGRFRGEQIQLIGGRFEFDTINSLAFFKENQVEISTDAGGWYQAAEEDLNAENLKRPDVRFVSGGSEGGAGSVGGIDFFTIKEVLLTREGDEQVLGLRTAAGDYIRMDRRGALRRTRGCPEYLGDDGFWRYEKTEGALVITAFRSKEGKAIRSIQDGRFTDDIVHGLPVTAVDVEGIYYLIPTQAGVLGFDQDLRPHEIHAKPFPGLPPDTVPEILFMLTPDTPLYAAPDGLRFLNGSRDVFPDMKLRVPEGAVLTAVENGPQDFVRARWKIKETGRRGWTLLTPGKSKAAWENTIYVNVNGFDRYIKNRKTWGYPEPWIQIRLKPHQMEVSQLGSPIGHILHFQNPIALLTPIVKDETLFLIGKKNLLEINLEHAMTKSFEAATDKHGRTRTKD